MSANNRSIEDARAKHALMGQYIAECERIELWKTPESVPMMDVPRDVGQFVITDDERLEVFERRRDRIYNALTNAGIKLHAETTDTLPSIAKAYAEQGGDSESR